MPVMGKGRRYSLRHNDASFAREQSTGPGSYLITEKCSLSPGQGLDCVLLIITTCRVSLWVKIIIANV